MRKDKSDYSSLYFVWILNYPLFIWNKDLKIYESTRHVFTSPIESDKNFFLNSISYDEIKSDSFDLVCNGEEIVSGGIRINSYELQKKVFEFKLELEIYSQESKKKGGVTTHSKKSKKRNLKLNIM